MRHTQQQPEDNDEARRGYQNVAEGIGVRVYNIFLINAQTPVYRYKLVQTLPEGSGPRQLAHGTSAALLPAVQLLAMVLCVQESGEARASPQGCLGGFQIVNLHSVHRLPYGLTIPRLDVRGISIACRFGCQYVNWDNRDVIHMQITAGEKQNVSCNTTRNE